PRGIVRLHDLPAKLVGGGDHRAAGLAGVEERLAVYLARYRVVDDVAALDPFVLVPQPGIEPEAFDPDDLLLLVPHRAGDVHHVDDHRVRFRDVLQLVGAVPAILAHRNHHRHHRIVRPHGDLSPQGLLVGALEVAKRFRSGGVDAGVFDFLGDDPLVPAALDVRQLKLFAEDLRQLVEGNVHLERVLALSLSRLPAVAGLHRARGELLANLPIPLTHAALLLVAVLEMRNVDERHRDRDHVLAPLADQLALLHVLLQIGFDLSADDLFEARMVLMDLQSHATPSLPPRPTLW